jgi:hypothetical protein
VDSVTICIPTFGSEGWRDLGKRTFNETVARFPDIRISRAHRDDLQTARNDLLGRVETEWVCFLDADDELEPGYFDAMAQGTADLRAPAIRYVAQYYEPPLPTVPRVAGHTHACTADCLIYGNWLVIGTVARTAILRSVGGFHDFPCYEDWDLWLRAWKAGATVEAVPTAIYRATVRPDSRNRGGSNGDRMDVHRDIARANDVPVPGTIEWSLQPVR